MGRFIIHHSAFRISHLLHHTGLGCAPVGMWGSWQVFHAETRTEKRVWKSRNSRKSTSRARLALTSAPKITILRAVERIYKHRCQ
ncbi:MAG: hypothetical protein WD065_07930, partial [Planctomycetaceae bacterium]